MQSWSIRVWDCDSVERHFAHLKEMHKVSRWAEELIPPLREVFRPMFLSNAKVDLVCLSPAEVDFPSGVSFGELCQRVVGEKGLRLCYPFLSFPLAAEVSQDQRPLFVASDPLPLPLSWRKGGVVGECPSVLVVAGRDPRLYATRVSEYTLIPSDWPVVFCQQ